MPIQSSIVRSDDLRHENRHRVLDCLRAYGPAPQTVVSGRTGLSAASISSLLAQLTEQGILISHRQKVGAGGRGRPQSLIAFNALAGDIITVNLTFDFISVARVDYTNHIIDSVEHSTSTRTLSEKRLLDLIVELIEQIIQRRGNSKIMRIGVVFQGVTENESGVLAWSPMLNVQNVNLGEHLQQVFQLPVNVDNDCKLTAYALRNSSHETLGNSFATILFSDGVGLGLIINGEPFSGIRSSALELGHLCFERNGSLCRCGRNGCIEAYASDYGIARLAIGQSIHDNPSGRIEASLIEQLCDAAKAGEEPAIQAFTIAGAAIGEGLRTLFTLFDPMPVALVGRSLSVFELIKPQIISAFNNEDYNHVPIENLLHCYDNAQPLVNSGVAGNTLALLDHQFAYLNQS